MKQKNSKKIKTHCSRDGPNNTYTSHPTLELLGDEIPVHGLDIESLLTHGEIMKGEPEGWDSVGWMKVDLIGYVGLV